MLVNILTIFPEYFSSVFNVSILKRAQDKNKVQIKIVDIRDFAQDKHKRVDDRPFGGGPGMVMKIEPIDLALNYLGLKKGQDKSRIILTSAKGQLWTQKKAQKISNIEQLAIICGHYEGVDERVAENLVDEEVRIGDYVITGGESAATVIVDSIVRLIPGVLGNEESSEQESHSTIGYLAAPTYTRPREYKTWKVPEVLLKGDHKEIESFKKRV